ncbi:MAG TPA: hypothetical protein VFK02_16700 [Kofleriaceae bacterium]|nr:hypothetical protein [Kofleriaceae bacterium]
MTDWVLAAERAYVAAAVAQRGPGLLAATVALPAPSTSPATPDSPASARAHAVAATSIQARAIAAAGAIASRYLAVGTPRSFGIVIDDPDQVDAAALTLAAHRTWFAPRDLRCASTGAGAEVLAAIIGGRGVSIDEALACDIVHVHSTRVCIRPAQLRRGTHVNAVSADVLDPELVALATFVREADLPALAAGLIDGRQLDEITIFAIDGAPVATAARLA